MLLAGCALALSICGGGRNAQAETKAGISSSVVDRPLAGYQAELLDLAFDTATSIPVNPFVKERSRQQEEVVVACIKLDQPQRASQYTKKIINWLKGSCEADLAIYYAQKGQPETAEKYLKSARTQSEIAEDWRKDRIKVKIAQFYALLGQSQQAEQFEKDVVDSEKGKVAAIKAARGGKESFDEQVKALDAMIASGNFDLQQNALESYAKLFNSFYADAGQRVMAEKKIKSGWEKMPIAIRFDMMTELTGYTLDHGDRAKSLELVNETQKFLDEYQWPQEERFPRVAKLAELRFRAGDKTKARADADGALALFNNPPKNTITDIWRAGALRPLAHAYQVMGDAKAALTVYRQVIEEGVKNPNSRPRAEDLSATCAAMAVDAVAPDAALLSRIRQIKRSLAEPW